MSKILLIEDEPSLAEPLAFLLQQKGYVVKIVTNGVAGLEYFLANNDIDLVLLDLMLPKLAGIEVCSRIREKSEVPIIILTAKDSEFDKIQGLELGADDYVTKPYFSGELIARIRSVLRRNKPELVEAILSVGTLSLDKQQHTVTLSGKKIFLPLKEFALLECLMLNRGKVVCRTQLIAKVWGENYYGDTKTLDVHIRRLRNKIESDPGYPERIITVRGVGYKVV